MDILTVLTLPTFRATNVNYLVTVIHKDFYPQAFRKLVCFQYAVSHFTLRFFWAYVINKIELNVKNILGNVIRPSISKN